MTDKNGGSTFKLATTPQHKVFYVAMKSATK